MKLSVVVMLVAIIAVGVNGEPQNGMKSARRNDRGSYYWLDYAYVTWGQAKKNCEADGAYLAIVNSVDEATYLRDFVKEHQPNEYAFFIGFHDLFIEGDYVTVLGQPLQDTGYYSWGQGQPDNYNGIEDCGAFRADGYLADVSCDVPNMYICEWD